MKKYIKVTETCTKCKGMGIIPEFISDKNHGHCRTCGGGNKGPGTGKITRSVAVEVNEFVLQVDGSCRRNGQENASMGVGIKLKQNKNSAQDFSYDLSVEKVQNLFSILGLPVPAIKPTNNVAELVAAIVAIKMALKGSATKITLLTDSTLVKGFCEGGKAKAENMRDLAALLQMYVAKVPEFEVQLVSRTDNTNVDKLAKNASA
jgi:ribonuclease HI